MPGTNLLDPPKSVDAPKIAAPPKRVDSKPSLVGAAARLYWMLAGNAALYLTALAIAQQGRESAWIADAAFWGIVGSLALVRYADIARLGGATASGEPASLVDWRRYVRRLLVLSFAGWIIARAVAQVGIADLVL